jgi:hypothetical protein
MVLPGRELVARLCWAGFLLAVDPGSAFCSNFNFQRDTFAFQNATVLKYKNGLPTLQRQLASDPANQYTRRCFVMSRAAVQFQKFARFDPRGPALDDDQLARRVRAIARHHPWAPALPENQRIVFPGYANLRQMSKARRDVFQKNLGSGFATYFRPSNARMFFQRGREYQDRTHTNLTAILARGDFFVAYLSTYPKLNINHTVLIYRHKAGRAGDGNEHYFVYDPNHAESPRELVWSPRERTFSYQKDIDFVGGPVRVYQAYGKWLQ